MLNAFVTPTISPGEVANVSFNLTNPYNVRELNAIAEVALEVDIYMYATQEKSVPVDASFPRPPSIGDHGTHANFSIEVLPPGASYRVYLPIDTSKKTPHGSYFSQSTYFLRFNLTFRFSTNDTFYVLKSRGWFTDEQWNHIVTFTGNESIVNRTYLKTLGVDGLIPDSAFGIKTPIPRWPLALIVVGAIGLSSVALYYFTLENPGKYPRLEKRLYKLRGKLNELRGKLKHGR
jgi:hypothetical protein